MAKDKPATCDMGTQTEERVFSSQEMEDIVEKTAERSAMTMASQMEDKLTAFFMERELQPRAELEEVKSLLDHQSASSKVYPQSPASTGAQDFPVEETQVRKAKRKPRPRPTNTGGGEEAVCKDAQFFLRRYSTDGRLDLDRLQAACRCGVLSFKKVLNILEARMLELEGANAPEDEDEIADLMIAKDAVSDVMNCPR